MKSSRTVIGCVAALIAALALSGCDQNAAEIEALKADNERLRTELALLRNRTNGVQETEMQAGKADLVLGINALWSQRFEDSSEFRAKQRLAGKTIRVTGVLDNLSANAVSLSGVGTVSRSVRMSANLDPAYAIRVQEGLAALEKGATVTMQGKFAYDRMGLDESVFVDKATGATLFDAELKALGEGGTSAPPLPLPIPDKQ